MNSPRFIDLVTGRWAVSLRVWAILAVMIALSYYARTRIRLNAEPLIVLALSAIGALALGLMLLIADRTWLRNRRVRPVSLAAVILAWVLANLLRALVDAVLMLQLFDIPVISQFPRFLATMVPILTWAAVFSYFFALRDYYRQVSQDLRASTAALREAGRQKLSTLDELRQVLAMSVETAVIPALRRLEGELNELHDESSEQQLQELSETAGGYSRQLVRDVSHAISGGAWQPVLSGAQEASSDRAAPGFDDWRQAPIAVGWASAIALTTAVPLVASNYSSGTWPGVVLGLAAWVAVLVGFRRLQPALVRKRGIPAVGVLAIASVLAWAAASTVMLLMRTADGVSEPLTPFIAFSAFLLLTCLITSSMARSVMLLRRDSELLAGQNEEFARISEELDASTAILRKQVAEMLHGPIQGRLAAVALSIRLFADARAQGRPVSARVTFQRCRALLEQVNRDIDAIMTGRFERPMPIRGRIALLCDRWAGLLDVSFSIGDEAEPLIDRDRLLQGRVFSVVEEAVNNACSHGRARNASVAIGLDGDGSVVIEAVDDGVGVPATVEAGLGLREVEAFGGSWSLMGAGERGARLVVTVPRSESVDEGLELDAVGHA